MYKKFIVLLLCCFFGITFIGPAAAFDEVENIDDQGNDIYIENSFEGFEGVLIENNGKNCPVSDFNQFSDSNLTGLSGSKGLKELGDYIYCNFDYKRYSGSTSESLIRNGYGDCWALCEFAYNVLKENDYNCYIEEIKTKQSDHHRRIQVKVNGEYQVFDPSLCTKHYKYKDY